MASVSDGGKRKHIETERMKEFKANLKDNKDKKRHCTYPGCGKTFTSIPGLKYHIDTHSPVKSSFICNYCKRSFRSNNGLKYHHNRCKSCNHGDTGGGGGGGGNDTNNNTEFRRSTRTSPLSITVSEEPVDMKPRVVDDNRLRDLAIIATGPTSPLLHNISFTDRLDSERCSRTVKRALDLSCKPKVETKPGLILSQLDTSAVITLSNMAKRKYSKQSNVKSPPELQITTKVKRPMNGFLIFAKRKRLFYKEKFPNKDNRAISTLLGEKWKSLCHKKKEIYKEEAKQLAENLLKQHPDCWKRKRS